MLCVYAWAGTAATAAAEAAVLAAQVLRVYAWSGAVECQQQVVLWVAGRRRLCALLQRSAGAHGSSSPHSSSSGSTGAVLAGINQGCWGRCVVSVCWACSS